MRPLLRQAPVHYSDKADRFLTKCAWPQTLSKHEMEVVSEKLTTQRHEAGAYVCHRNEIADSWIGVVEGLLRVQDTTEDGQTIVYTWVASGGWIGEGSLLKIEKRRYEIVAQRRTETLHLPRETFSWLIDRSVPFNHFLLSHLNERLGQFIASTKYGRVLKPAARVARCIASLFHPVLYPNMNSTLKLSQEELAWMVGVSRSSVNIALNELERRGLIQRGYKGLTVIDRDGLMKFDP